MEKLTTLSEKNLAHEQQDSNTPVEILTILVPAWKHNYLREALSSIDAQTDKRFSVIIFDDAGPPEIRNISSNFPQFEYYRFDSNLGGSDLVGHWNRCLKMVRTKWVWMFSDDDVMSSNCVSAFYKGLDAKPNAAIFQLSVKQVDSSLNHLMESRPLQHESAEDFIIARFSSSKISCVPNYIFNWDVLKDKAGGFVNFPLAWNSDDATWVLLAKEKGVFGLKSGEVLWRQSQQNISTSCSLSSQKLVADIQYLEWLKIMGFKISYWKQLRWLAARLAYVYKFNKIERSTIFNIFPYWLMPSLILMRAYPALRRMKILANKCLCR